MGKAARLAPAPAFAHEPAMDTYAHRPKPFSAEATFTLAPRALEIEHGRRSGRFPYPEIAEIRLSYRPRNTTNEAYAARIIRHDRVTASLSNISWKTLVEFDRQDAAYAAFLRALIARVAAANPDLVLHAGLGRLHFAAATVVGVATVLATIWMAGWGLTSGATGFGLLALGFGLFFGWWSLRFLSANRPRRFAAGHEPANVMPKP